MEKRSLIAYDYYKESSQKFDYFMTGLIGALCAYIGQSYHSEKIMFSPNTLELISLIILFLSFFFSFKRQETTVQLFKLNHVILDLSEKKGILVKCSDQEYILNEETGDILSKEDIKSKIKYFNDTIPKREDELIKWKKKSKIFYSLRNWHLFSGFFLMIISRIWQAYI